MENSNFIAIDFETATNDKEPCQLGIVIVKNWSIIQKMSYLIRPKDNHYDYNCSSKHNITAIETKDAPEFPYVWNEVRAHFENSIVVAHKADFDRDVLFKSLQKHGLEFPDCSFICTYKMTGFGLEKSCEVLGVPLTNHHDALCDAEAAANIFIKTNKQGISSVMLSPKLSYNKKEEKEEYFTFIDALSELNIIEDELFLNKRFILTGVFENDREKIKEVIKKLGGKISSSVNKSIDFAVLGENPGFRKMQDLSDLANERIFIKRLSESEILEMINDALKKQGFDLFDIYS